VQLDTCFELEILIILQYCLGERGGRPRNSANQFLLYRWSKEIAPKNVQWLPKKVESRNCKNGLVLRGVLSLVTFFSR